METQTQEMADALYNTSLALEEMIVYQEGKLPHRVLATQATLGYNEARKVVLNEARAQLRRTKTYMLRVGILRPIANSDGSIKGAEPGVYHQTVEKTRDGTGHAMNDKMVASTPMARPFHVKHLVFLSTALALFGAGFHWPICHAILSVIAVCVWLARSYWRIVGVRFE